MEFNRQNQNKGSLDGTTTRVLGYTLGTTFNVQRSHPGKVRDQLLKLSNIAAAEVSFGLLLLLLLLSKGLLLLLLNFQEGDRRRRCEHDRRLP